MPLGYALWHFSLHFLFSALLIAFSYILSTFITLFSIYPYTGKTVDVEIVKNIKYNTVQHTVLSH